MTGDSVIASLAPAGRQVARIRVLHVIEAIDGGVKRHVMSILASVDRRRFEVEVAGPTQRLETDEGETFAADVEATGVRLNPIEMARAVSPLHDLRALLQLWRLIRRRRYDVIHGHSSKGGFLARVAGWLTGTPSIYTANALYFLRLPPGARRMLYTGLERLAGHVTTRFVAVSESEAEVAIRERLVARRKVVVIPNGVEAEAFNRPAHARAHIRAELQIPLDAVVIGTAARLTAQKDPECLVRAVREVVGRTRREVFLVWAGDGELGADVRRVVAECGLEHRCRFLGTRRDVRAVMCAFDVVALTSRYEGLPYVLLEAMALGLPVVATDVVGSRDVVEHEVNGYLVPPESPAAVADALLALVNSDTRRAELGERGRRMAAERYTLESMTRRLEALYTELAERPSGSPVEGRWLRRETAST
jgi:glycosyltransferase involved in cell wall biosynthesis